MPEERLHKILSRCGIDSRRKCEALIVDGRVAVNGRTVTTLGTKADPATDIITVDGRRVKAEDKVYIMFNKPAGCVTATSDPDGKPTVFDYFKDYSGPKLFHVGRLDYDTEGLLLLTSDGDFCQKVTHPSSKVYKTYIATVAGIPCDDILSRLRDGVTLEDGPTAPAKVRFINTIHKPVIKDRRGPVIVSNVEISIREGRKRQVRRMFSHLEFPVRRLVRIKIGALELGALKKGQYRILTRQEAERALRDRV